jgi:hypothetical protein
MAAYTQIGGTTIQAFQWKGGKLTDYTFPPWANHLALHTSGDGILQVPIRSGVDRAIPTNWIVQGADLGISILPNSEFILLYH